MKKIAGLHPIPLQPYPGKLFFAETKEAFNAALDHLRWDIERMGTTDCRAGRAASGMGREGLPCFLIYADNAASLAHEVVHTVFAVFDLIGASPLCGAEEPFCYMVSQIMTDIGARVPRFA